MAISNVIMAQKKYFFQIPSDQGQFILALDHAYPHPFPQTSVDPELAVHAHPLDPPVIT
jgi:hypothetical protein